MEQSDIKSLWAEVYSPSPADFCSWYFINLLSRLGIIMMHLWISLKIVLKKITMLNHEEVILLGDFNCNLARTSLSESGKRLYTFDSQESGVLPTD